MFKFQCPTFLNSKEHCHGFDSHPMQMYFLVEERPILWYTHYTQLYNAVKKSWIMLQKIAFLEITTETFQLDLNFLPAENQFNHFYSWQTLFTGPQRIRVLCTVDSRAGYLVLSIKTELVESKEHPDRSSRSSRPPCAGLAGFEAEGEVEGRKSRKTLNSGWSLQSSCFSSLSLSLLSLVLYVSGCPPSLTFFLFFSPFFFFSSVLDCLEFSQVLSLLSFL